MIPSTIIIFAFCPMFTVAFNFFKHTSVANIPEDDQKDKTLLPDNIKVDMTISYSRKPEFYNKAMLELKRLEDEPMCHRLAAHLLMNTCRGLQDINEQTLQTTKAKMQRNHVESFAAALTLCDMEGVNWEIPDACVPLSSSVMHRTIEEDKTTLVVPSEQVQACLTTLSKDHTHWMTWLHRRDSALLFCRAASIDMDKDQMFETQKLLVKIMTDFAKELDIELTLLKVKLEGQTREADQFFQEFMEHAKQMKSRFQGTMDHVSKDVKVVASSIASIKDSGLDIQRFLQSLFQTAVAGHAEMAAKQEESLAVSTQNMQTRLGSINDMAERAETYAVVMGRAMEHLSSRLEVLADQQEDMEKKSQSVLVALANATDLFYMHAEQLEKASFTAAKIHDSLGNVATITDFISSYTDMLHVGGSWGDWAIRAFSPPSAIMIGSYGLPPSLFRNVFLFIAGATTGEVIVLLRRSGDWSWSYDSFVPSTFTQLARKHINREKLQANNDIEDSQINSLIVHFDTN
ncbi:hypothetical protein GLAREA_01468 [Glarea lozoyensis ATCC 20868]|uniref:Nuclear fusion protein KAR5 n=1 Tax=Glarea lozoyensis (strain ATCC 20868 / MF5171) TaxID=1116229 RepID=S3D0H5_GLAL2|nr:uncharacterized protein GLAREA_01468 [Glarea lozoyensis ATCC 20868]EPE25556.1 hypothetical protein GLAREA_01468 [Glarea lozoyensis ATCC 20868]